MAIAFVAAADGGNNGGTGALTYSYTCGSGANRLLVACVIGDNTAGGSNDDITGVTYNGVSMTLAVKQTTIDLNNRITYLYYLLNPASGAHNIVVSSTNNHYLFSGAADYTGVKQSAQPDATLASIGANANISTFTSSLTTVADNSWIILVENGYQSNTPPAASTGLNTVRAVDAVFGGYGLFDSGNITPAGSHGMTTTRSNASDSIIHVKASFQPDTGGGSFIPAWAMNTNLPVIGTGTY